MLFMHCKKTAILIMRAYNIMIIAFLQFSQHYKVLIETVYINRRFVTK